MDHVAFLTEAVIRVLLPSAAVALVVALGIRIVAGERAMGVAAGLALAAGVFAGNHFCGAMSWNLGSEKPLAVAEWQAAFQSTLKLQEPYKTPPPPDLPERRHWLPWLAALAVVVELLPYGVAGWTVRAVVAVLAGLLLVAPGAADAPDAAAEGLYLKFGLPVAILACWAVAAAVAKGTKDGLMPMTLAGCLFAASAVIALSGTTSMAHAAMLPAAALVPITLVAWVRKGNPSPALAACAVLLPGLMACARQASSADMIPMWAYVAVGAAPLAAALPAASLGGEGRPQRHATLLAVVLPWAAAGAGVMAAARAMGVMGE